MISEAVPALAQLQTGLKPCEERAVCKYRWGRVIRTNCPRVIFFCSAHPKEPVFLQLSPEGAAYYSEDMHVLCGDYTGHVIVEGKSYPVEPFSIRTYTFEVDLFLKEDVIEDNVATSKSLAQELKFQQQQLQQQQSSSIDTYCDISKTAGLPLSRMEENGMDDGGARLHSRYEELLRQQLQHKNSLDESTIEKELALTEKSDQSICGSGSGSGSKRLTPVGDIDKEVYLDGFSSLAASSSAAPRQDYDADRHSMRSGDLGSSYRSLGDAGEPVMLKSPSRGGSDYVGSLTGSRPGSARIDDILGSASAQRQTARETIADVLGSEAILASPTARSISSGSIRQTSDKDVGIAGSPLSSARSTPRRETHLTSDSNERLYGSQELFSTGEQHSMPPGGQTGSYAGSRPGSRTGSLAAASSRSGSQVGSRAQSLSSLSSEVELSQFMNAGGKGRESEGDPSPANFNTHPDESASLPPIWRGRPSSVPSYSTQIPPSPDGKRTYTPDHRTWPASSDKGGALPASVVGLPPSSPAGRFDPRSSVSSRTSSRTVTPVPVGEDREDGGKVRDVEETISTLRKLLSSREREVHDVTSQLQDLKDINSSLKKDLEHARSRRTTTGPEELQQQYQQMLQEKEILAAEVVKLRDRLESIKGTGVDSFSTHSATSMQKRIDELEAHVRDLRLTNDVSSQKLLKAELCVKELEAEIDRLRSSSRQSLQDSRDDRAGHYSEQHLLIEIQQLKEDVRNLRDRNFVLQEENLKLKEGIESAQSLDHRNKEGREFAKPTDHRSKEGREFAKPTDYSSKEGRDFPQPTDYRSKEGRETAQPSDFRSKEVYRDATGRTSLNTGRGPSDNTLRPTKDILQRAAKDYTLSARQDAAHLFSGSGSRHHQSHEDLTFTGHSVSRRHLDRSYGSDSFPYSAKDSRDVGPQHSLEHHRGPPKHASELGPSKNRLNDKERLMERDLQREKDLFSGASYSVSKPEARARDLYRDSYPRVCSTTKDTSDRGSSDKDGLGKYADYAAELRRTDPGLHDLRSRPDGEVSEKLLPSDAAKYGMLSAEKLRAFDREREAERGQPVKPRISMSAERLRILEEAERNRDRIAQLAASGQRAAADLGFVTNKEDTRQRKPDSNNNSDDSDSTAALISYDAKAETLSGQKEKDEGMYSERNGTAADNFYDRYRVDKDLDRNRYEKREYKDYKSGSLGRSRGSHRDKGVVSTAPSNGDDSDTATDILLSAEPTRLSTHHRRSSIADDASLSSLSDEEQQESLRRRSRSADGKGKTSSHHSAAPPTLRPAASTEALGVTSRTLGLASGFRTVTPQPLATQQNRHHFVQHKTQQQEQQPSLSSSLTQGLRPFAPNLPSDIRIDDIVKFNRQGGKVSMGTVKFVGHLPGRGDVYLGVELYKEEGKHDGTFEGVRYFKCKPNKGVFVAFNKVVLVYGPN